MHAVHVILFRPHFLHQTKAVTSFSISKLHFCDVTWQGRLICPGNLSKVEPFRSRRKPIFSRSCTTWSSKWIFNAENPSHNSRLTSILKGAWNVVFGDWVVLSEFDLDTLPFCSPSLNEPCLSTKYVMCVIRACYTARFSGLIKPASKGTPCLTCNSISGLSFSHYQNLWTTYSSLVVYHSYGYLFP